jgi:hypothetical protein
VNPKWSLAEWRLGLHFAEPVSESAFRGGNWHE